MKKNCKIKYHNFSNLTRLKEVIILGMSSEKLSGDTDVISQGQIIRGDKLYGLVFMTMSH